MNWMLVVTVMMVLMPHVGAHDGHDEVSLLFGTVVNVERQRIESLPNAITSTGRA
jgi:hypothetical protein